MHVYYFSYRSFFRMNQLSRSHKQPRLHLKLINCSHDNQCLQWFFFTTIQLWFCSKQKDCFDQLISAVVKSHKCSHSVKRISWPCYSQLSQAKIEKKPEYQQLLWLWDKDHMTCPSDTFKVIMNVLTRYQLNGCSFFSKTNNKEIIVRRTVQFRLCAEKWAHRSCHFWIKKKHWKEHSNWTLFLIIHWRCSQRAVCPNDSPGRKKQIFTNWKKNQIQKWFLKENYPNWFLKQWLYVYLIKSLFSILTMSVLVPFFWG